MWAGGHAVALQNFLQKAAHLRFVEAVAALDGVLAGHLGHAPAHALARDLPAPGLPFVQRLQKQLARGFVFAKECGNGLDRHAGIVEGLHLKPRVRKHRRKLRNQRPVVRRQPHQLRR